VTGDDRTIVEKIAEQRVLADLKTAAVKRYCAAGGGGDERRLWRALVYIRSHRAVVAHAAEHWRIEP
jgi:hypothetical protein